MMATPVSFATNDWRFESGTHLSSMAMLAAVFLSMTSFSSLERLPVILYALTSAIPWIYSRTRSTILLLLSTRSCEAIRTFRRINELMSWNTIKPTVAIKAIRQSKNAIITIIKMVSRIPCVTIMTTRVATSPSCSMVFVVTEVM